MGFNYLMRVTWPGLGSPYGIKTLVFMMNWSRIPQACPDLPFSSLLVGMNKSTSSSRTSSTPDLHPLPSPHAYPSS